jgi:hypothetical protein
MSSWGCHILPTECVRILPIFCHFGWLQEDMELPSRVASSVTACNGRPPRHCHILTTEHIITRPLEQHLPTKVIYDWPSISFLWEVRRCPVTPRLKVIISETRCLQKAFSRPYPFFLQFYGIFVSSFFIFVSFSALGVFCSKEIGLSVLWPPWYGAGEWKQFYRVYKNEVHGYSSSRKIAGRAVFNYVLQPA